MVIHKHVLCATIICFKFNIYSLLNFIYFHHLLPYVNIKYIVATHDYTIYQKFALSVFSAKLSRKQTFAEVQ